MKSSSATLISSPENIIYYTGYSGFSATEREAFLLLVKNRKIIITDSRYANDINKIKGFELIEMPAKTFLGKQGGKILKAHAVKDLGIEESNLTVEEYKSLRKVVKTNPIDLSNLRVIKRGDEIKNIKLACKIADSAFEFIIKQFKLGITEKEIETKLEQFIKSENADISFKPIVAFGKNSASPHHLSNSTKLNKNQIILLDFGVRVNNYCSDLSRTIFSGSVSKKFKNMYNVVLESQTRAIKSIRANASTSSIDSASRKVITSNALPAFPHALGHGVGILVHETPILSPLSKEKIKNGMVFTVEPGVYIPGFGGVRIEDIVVVRQGFAELISKAKREIIELHV